MSHRSLPELTQCVDAHRDRLGISDAEVLRRLAKRGLHVKPPLYSRYRSGQRAMPPSVLGGLCDVFEVSEPERLRLFNLLAVQDRQQRAQRCGSSWELLTA